MAGLFITGDSKFMKLHFSSQLVTSLVRDAPGVQVTGKSPAQYLAGSIETVWLHTSQQAVCRRDGLAPVTLSDGWPPTETSRRELVSPATLEAGR
ncbi:MAG: hypothetical protein J07HR59_00129 [Halorubrum sp. J07HR59]|nr:MAG: hypothetical protein J07HR59_00129 [Halorubrum sp. J07HR59]